jgi:hypothetical protein
MLEGDALRAQAHAHATVLRRRREAPVDRPRLGRSTGHASDQEWKGQAPSEQFEGGVDLVAVKLGQGAVHELYRIERSLNSGLPDLPLEGQADVVVFSGGDLAVHRVLVCRLASFRAPRVPGSCLHFRRRRAQGVLRKRGRMHARAAETSSVIRIPGV